MSLQNSGVNPTKPKRVPAPPPRPAPPPLDRDTEGWKPSPKDRSRLMQHATQAVVSVIGIALLCVIVYVVVWVFDLYQA